MNQKHWGKPLLFHDKCSGFFYVHYFNNLVHNGLMSHPKDEAIIVKCLAQGHKGCNWPGQDSNPQHQSNALDRSATTLGAHKSFLNPSQLPGGRTQLNCSSSVHIRAYQKQKSTLLSNLVYTSPFMDVLVVQCQAQTFVLGGNPMLNLWSITYYTNL